MKIRKLQLKNIGVFDDETIEFQPCPAKDKAEIHILTGQNGSGKTTILMALANAFERNEHNFFLSSLKNLFGKRFRKFEGKNIDGDISNEIKVIFDEDETESIIGLQHGQGFSYLTPAITAPFESENTKNYLIDRYYIHKLESYRMVISSQNISYILDKEMSFAVFAFSGYRQIYSERIEAIREPKDFNPLSQSLEFVKDYTQSNQLTINQLITNNLSKSAIERGRNKEKSERFANVVKSIEKAIFEITDLKVEFDLETEPTNLVTKVNGEELDFDVLPDGLRSLISWIADLLGRVDLLKWQDDLPITEKNLILLLDEIEVHLHPAWQRKVLPVVQKLFKNAQIFVSTHSPFVVNSVDDAWVYKLELENGKAKVVEIVESENSNSITQVLREVFGIDQWFGLEVQNNFERFQELKNKIISNGADEAAEKELLEKAKILADEPNDQLKQMIKKDLEQLSEIKKKPYTL